MIQRSSMEETITWKVNGNLKMEESGCYHMNPLVNLSVTKKMGCCVLPDVL